MNSNFLLRSFRILLLPFALVYAVIIKVRNWCYNKHIFKSTKFNLPIINIGNLSVGGTGKSPMVLFLLKHLQHYNIATLSRGYKRKTKGYLLATANTTPLDIGDEPYLFYITFPNVPIAVGEDRVLAVPQLLQDAPDTQVILLDDAMQHRAIQPSMHLLLTDYNNLYVDDFYLPTGDLRDDKKRALEAAIIIVTKCPTSLTTDEAAAIIKKLHLPQHINVYFSSIMYEQPQHLITKQPIALSSTTEVLLVTGIANPKPIEQLLESSVASYEKMSFSDHHIFTIADVKNIEKQFTKLSSNKKIILTTAKDAVRLLKFGNDINHLPIYILPISLHFLFEQEQAFLNDTNTHIQQFPYNN